MLLRKIIRVTQGGCSVKDSSQFYEIFQKSGCCLFEIRQKGKALFLCNYINVGVTSTCEELKLKCPTTYLDMTGRCAILTVFGWRTRSKTTTDRPRWWQFKNSKSRELQRRKGMNLKWVHSQESEKAVEKRPKFVVETSTKAIKECQ